ncbi:unnamed protein product [Rhizophagus irregularis]|nr:unnamed protein product [Rhizophagus irregularis]
MKFNNLLLIINVLVTYLFVANNIIIDAVPLILRDASNATDANDGKWEFVGKTGVSAMHMTLIRPTKVLIIDKAGINPEALIANGNLHTNTFCSAGAYLANGTMVETGGAEDTAGEKNGFQSVRLIDGCDDGNCDWLEFPYELDSARWYNTMASLPDGRRILSHLNLYPTVIVLPGPKGQTWLFLAANKKAQIWDYTSKEIVKHLPDIPGGPRTYPLTGTGALIPLSYRNNYQAEIIVINLADKNPQWDEDEFGPNMETGRLMPDVIHLPDGKLLYVNGAGTGMAGWDKKATNKTPRLHTADPIVRVYHSSATLVPDGTVFVAGSNPNRYYCGMDQCEHPTEHRAEKFYPPYLLNGVSRPTITKVAGHTKLNDADAIPVKYGQTISVEVEVDSPTPQFTSSLSHMVS